MSQRISSLALFEALRQLLPPKVFIQYGAVRIRCNVAGATVTIDGKVRGKTPIVGPIRLRAPARHRVRVGKKGYVPFGATLFVPPRATITVKAQLVPVGLSVPAYKKWWFWTAIAGSVAVTAAGIVGFLVWRHNAAEQPTRVQVFVPPSSR